MKQAQSEHTLKTTTGKRGSTQKKDEESIANQWQNVQRMKKENSLLREEIKTEKRFSSINETMQNNQMDRIQEEGSKYARKIEIETKKMQELQNQIDQTQKQLTEKRLLFNSSDASEVPNLLKKVKTLEYKLEKIRMRHNESLAEIKSLKEEVNAARRERVIFDSVFKKLETDLKLKEEELKRYLFEALQVQREKELASEELHKIRGQSDKELQQFQQQYNRAFQLQEDFDLDNDDYILDKSNFKDSKIISSVMVDNTINQTPVQQHTHEKHKKLLPKKNTQQFEQDTQQIQLEIEKYEMIFEKLKIEANVDSVEQFIESYQCQEKINNDLYESSNNLNDQIENLQKQIKEVQVELKKYQSSKVEDNQDQNTMEINDLKIKLRESQYKNKTINQQNQEINDEIAHLTKQIPQLFSALGCVNKENPKEDLTEENINISNITQILATIEQRSNDIMELYNYFHQQEPSGAQQIQIQNDNQTDNKQMQFNRSEENNNIEKSFQSIRSNVSLHQKNKTQEKQHINDLLDAADKLKETEKIMTTFDFQNISKKDIDEFKDKQHLRNKKTQSHRKF